jgi:hypothetical protein
MTLRAKAVLAGALLAAVLSTAITPASANRLSLSNAQSTRAWRATWDRLALRAGVTTINCVITLEGSFHSGSFTKTRSTLIGHVTDHRGSCVNFIYTALRVCLKRL